MGVHMIGFLSWLKKASAVKIYFNRENTLTMMDGTMTYLILTIAGLN
jgi:hypothetical protein